jgi:hypothetical protein
MCSRLVTCTLFRSRIPVASSVTAIEVWILACIILGRTPSFILFVRQKLQCLPLYICTFSVRNVGVCL